MGCCSQPALISVLWPDWAANCRLMHLRAVVAKLEMLYIHWLMAPQHCHFCWHWTSFKCGSPGTLRFHGSQPFDATDVNGSNAVQAVV